MARNFHRSSKRALALPSPRSPCRRALAARSPCSDSTARRRAYLHRPQQLVSENGPQLHMRKRNPKMLEEYRRAYRSRISSRRASADPTRSRCDSATADAAVNTGAACYLAQLIACKRPQCCGCFDALNHSANAGSVAQVLPLQIVADTGYELTAISPGLPPTGAAAARRPARADAPTCRRGC